jgi:hypothetical protein
VAGCRRIPPVGFLAVEPALKVALRACREYNEIAVTGRRGKAFRVRVGNF